MRKLFIVLMLLLPALQSLAQRTCATESIDSNYNQSERKQVFEEWVRYKLANRQAVEDVDETQEETIYQIPVVIHIIHNGEPEGTGSNIADEQIFSQIEVLNEDFKRLNPDSVNTPPEFQPFASKINFEFILAKSDPNGLATTGIVRKVGSRTSWRLNNYEELMNESYWDPEDYVNIWVANITDFLGYATFPTSELEEGLPPNDLPNEGVLVTYGAFGSRLKYPSGSYEGFDFDLGRTTSHEMGHYFGLRHIWGDGDCSADDYVDDTPVSDGSYGNCPSIGPTSTTCGTQDMFMNYMDYVDDDCMNIFSNGQRDRMHVIINNSPRRLSLLSSPGLDEPVSTDASLVSINSPAMGICDSEVITNVTVMNNGSQVISQMQMEVRIDGVVELTQLFDVSIASLDTLELSFDPITLSGFGLFDFEVAILQVNGAADADTTNNTINTEVIRSQQVQFLDEDFENWPSNWELRTEGPVSAISVVDAISNATDNRAAKFAYSNVLESIDALQTPVVDLSSRSNAHLIFNWSYAHQEGSNDTLKILASNNCGASFDLELDKLGGADLSTAEFPGQHSPSGAWEWGFKAIDLSSLIGGSAQFGFVGISDGGNNIYLDDIKVVDSSYEDLAILGLNNRTAVFCDSPPNIGILIENRGVAVITAATFNISINGASPTEYMTDLNLATGERQIIDIPVSLNEEKNELVIEVLSDSIESNNRIARTILIQPDQIDLPIRESFVSENSAFELGWTTNSPNHNNKWTTEIAGSGGYSIGYKSFEDTNNGTQSYLVSPIMDFTALAEASLRFQAAYARNGEKNELLRIWASTDCSQKFNLLLAEFDKNTLTTATSSSNWTPTTEADWKQHFVSLDTLLNSQSARIAFEITNNNGNNIFLDDIEFLITDNPDEVQIASGTVAYYPNPVNTGILNLTFNLPEKEPVSVTIKNTAGQLVETYQLNGVLNQTYDFNLMNKPNGLYIIEVVSNSIQNSFKISLNQ